MAPRPPLSVDAAPGSAYAAGAGGASPPPAAELEKALCQDWRLSAQKDSLNLSYVPGTVFDDGASEANIT